MENTMAKANEGRLVEMKDGRKVSFGKRAKMIKEVLLDEGHPTHVRFDFDNGETRLLNLGRLTPEMEQALIAHGAKQKVGDECADLDNTPDYVAAVEAMIDRLYDGKWREEREGGFAGSATLIEACMEVFSKTLGEVRAILKDMKANERAALRQSEQIKPVADRIEAARSKDVDVPKLTARFQ
jgi:hypothetical protein